MTVFSFNSIVLFIISCGTRNRLGMCDLPGRLRLVWLEDSIRHGDDVDTLFLIL